MDLVYIGEHLVPQVVVVQPRVPDLQAHWVCLPAVALAWVRWGLVYWVDGSVRGSAPPDIFRI